MKVTILIYLIIQHCYTSYDNRNLVNHIDLQNKQTLMYLLGICNASNIYNAKVRVSKNIL